MTTLDSMLADLEAKIKRTQERGLSTMIVYVHDQKALISAIKSDRERVRREALEDAALVADQFAAQYFGEGFNNYSDVSMTIAVHIRALKDKEPT